MLIFLRCRRVDMAERLRACRGLCFGLFCMVPEWRRAKTGTYSHESPSSILRKDVAGMKVLGCL